MAYLGTRDAPPIQAPPSSSPQVSYDLSLERGLGSRTQSPAVYSLTCQRVSRNLTVWHLLLVNKLFVENACNKVNSKKLHSFTAIFSLQSLQMDPPAYQSSECWVEVQSPYVYKKSQTSQANSGPLWIHRCSEAQLFIHIYLSCLP